MRADMARVIVERPRRRGWAWKKPRGYQRRLRRYGEDGPPAREGIQARWQRHTKGLNAHLGPLRRYLDRQVGRPWDRVFSEVCAHIDRRSAVQDHVRAHVEAYVATRVILIDGAPCSGDARWGYGRPLDQLRWRPWYVCPRTGLLRRVKVKARRQPYRSWVNRPPESIRVSDRLQCRFLHGGWHLVTLAPLPCHPRGHSTERDVLLNVPVSRLQPSRARRHYGAEVYAVAFRRLARRELSQYPIPVRWWG